MNFKKKLLKINSLFLLVILISSCIALKHTKIIVENGSNLQIDSVKVIIQNYNLRIDNIKPGTKTEREILKENISLNNHDLTIQTFFYDKKKSNFEGGFYYTDLSSQLYDKYIITINKDLKVSIIGK